MKNNQHEARRKLLVRIVCGILVALMLSGALYYTIWGIASLFSA